MFKYILVMMSVNDTPTLPIALKINDLNTGYHDSTEISDINALVALVNYTLFKYSELADDEVLNGADHLFTSYGFACNFDTWIIDGNEFRYHSMREITADEFNLLNSLKLLSLVDPFNYEEIFLSKGGVYKFDDYMSSLSSGFKQQIVQDFKNIAFNLTQNIHPDLAYVIDIADLLSSYNFGQKLELINIVNKDLKSRSYNSYTLEESFCGNDFQLVFSNYTTQHFNQSHLTIEPLNFEIIINDEVMQDTQISDVMLNYGYIINLIKTDLYRNTFE